MRAESVSLAAATSWTAVSASRSKKFVIDVQMVDNVKKCDCRNDIAVSDLSRDDLPCAQ